MAKQSAGILLYRKAQAGYDVLIVHPGGPFWAKKDLGSWSIPKGEFAEGDDPLAAAKREFKEEIGSSPPMGEYEFLREVKYGDKTVHAFVLEADFNLERFHSNMFQMEWPPKSGRMQEFPENDRAAWVSLATARQKVVKGQVPIIETLATQLGQNLDDEPAGPQTSLF